MRTLQEKYNGINEGKFSKDQFLRDARLEQPTLVTQYNGYDDAVQILKNRGMIQEAKKQEGRKVTDHPFIVYTDKQGKHHIEEKNYEDDQKAFLKTIPNTWDVYETRKEAAAEKQRRMKKESVNEARLTKNNLTDYRYKATNDMDKYPYEQILRGLRVELEGLNVLGTPTPEEYTKALGKVLKNLQKDSIFYTNQVAGIKAGKKRTDVMIDATPKNEVDKENGLQKAALKEAIKGVIKNILSEGANLSPEGPQMFEDDEVYEMYGDSDGDYEHDKDTAAQAEMLYDKGQKLFNRGKKREAEALRQQAIKTASWLGWSDTDLPPYKTPEIPGFEGTRDALDNLFESVSLKDLLD